MFDTCLIIKANIISICICRAFQYSIQFHPFLFRSSKTNAKRNAQKSWNCNILFAHFYGNERKPIRRYIIVSLFNCGRSHFVCVCVYVCVEYTCVVIDAKKNTHKYKRMQDATFCVRNNLQAKPNCICTHNYNTIFCFREEKKIAKIDQHIPHMFQVSFYITYSYWMQSSICFSILKANSFFHFRCILISGTRNDILHDFEWNSLGSQAH